ncbi:MAG: translational GTPase TypA [Ferrimicrobium sp.]
MTVPAQLRNVAIVAHVDHGKTTLVDKMLRQSGAFRANQAVTDRIMDSMDLEREKGITIMAKNTSVYFGDVKINLVDTPGHADFGGEVERALFMVDGVILLVDAAEGPLPQTRFVLRKALERRLPILVVVNKVDRPDARPKEVLDEVLDLFIELGADETQIEFPTLFASGKSGQASWAIDLGDSDLQPLFQAIIDHIPPPLALPNAPLQAQVTNLDASPYLGRLAICRVVGGQLVKGSSVARISLDGSVSRIRIGELFITHFLERKAVDQVPAGELAIVAGIEDISIGETLADLNSPLALPPLSIDEPAIAMTLGVNTSPLAGREGGKLTARLIGTRLEQETIGNVAIKILATDRTDTFEVQGRGELALAVLIELMRREGFELTVSKPRALIREIDGKKVEPYELLEVDVPEAYFGSLTQIVSMRRAALETMHQMASGWIRATYMIPARGLLGVRGEVLSATRGTAIIHHTFEKWGELAGDIRPRAQGSLVADRNGMTTTYALLNLQDRGELFAAPQEEVYEGMVIGINSRPGDMDVNPTKEKKLTNMRSSMAEELVRLVPPIPLTLEAALEFISDDECVEVTPTSVRIRKVILPGNARAKQRRPSQDR